MKCKASLLLWLWNISMVSARLRPLQVTGSNAHEEDKLAVVRELSDSFEEYKLGFTRSLSSLTAPQVLPTTKSPSPPTVPLSDPVPMSPLPASAPDQVAAASVVIATPCLITVEIQNCSSLCGEAFQGCEEDATCKIVIKNAGRFDTSVTAFDFVYRGKLYLVPGKLDVLPLAPGEGLQVDLGKAIDACISREETSAQVTVSANANGFECQDSDAFQLVNTCPRTL